MSRSSIVEGVDTVPISASVADRLATTARGRQAQLFIYRQPVSWVVRAADLGGSACAVGAMLWLYAGLQKSRTIKVSCSNLQRWTIDRRSIRRCLRKLEAAALIAVTRPQGRKLVVTLLDVLDESPPLPAASSTAASGLRPA